MRGLWFLVVACGLVVGAPCRAQGEGVDPSAAYADGEFDVAAEGFLGAAEATGDPAAWFNLGNAHYRNGDPAQALWAFETARLLGMRRDLDCWRNAAMCRADLGVADDPGQAPARLARELLSPTEWVVLGASVHTVAALLLVLLWRRRWGRVLGALALVPALGISIELLWLGPARPPTGVVLVDVPVVGEPSAALDPILELSRGVRVDVLGGRDVGDWRCIRVGDQIGYVPVATLALLPRS